MSILQQLVTELDAGRVRVVDLTQPLVADQEKAVAPDDRAANDAAELVSAERRLGKSSLGIKRLQPIERPMAKELIARAVKRVCASFRGHVDCSGSPAAVLGRSAVGLNP